MCMEINELQFLYIILQIDIDLLNKLTLTLGCVQNRIEIGGFGTVKVKR